MRRRRRHLTAALFSLLAFAATALVALPFYWAISLSLRKQSEAFTVTGLGVPFVSYRPTLENWTSELPPSPGESNASALPALRGKARPTATPTRIRPRGRCSTARSWR